MYKQHTVTMPSDSKRERERARELLSGILTAPDGRTCFSAVDQMIQDCEYDQAASRRRILWQRIMCSAFAIRHNIEAIHGQHYISLYWTNKSTNIDNLIYALKQWRCEKRNTAMSSTYWNMEIEKSISTLPNTWLYRSHFTFRKALSKYVVRIYVINRNC